MAFSQMPKQSFFRSPGRDWRPRPRPLAHRDRRFSGSEAHTTGEWAEKKFAPRRASRLCG